MRIKHVISIKEGRTKKFDKINTIAVKISIMEAIQKLVRRKGIDFSKRKIIAIPINNCIFIPIKTKSKQIAESKSINPSILIIFIQLILAFN